MQNIKIYKNKKKRKYKERKNRGIRRKEEDKI